MYFDSKTLIEFLEEQGVRFRGPQNVPVEAVRALRGFVLDGVEQRAIVGGPGDTGDALDALGKDGPGAQVFHLQRELAESRGIGRIGEQAIIFTDFEGTQSKKRMAFCKQIQVEQQFFRGAFPIASPAMERVLLSLCGPREIEIATQAIRNGKIGLQDAPQHLLVKLLLKCLGGL